MFKMTEDEVQSTRTEKPPWKCGKSREALGLGMVGLKRIWEEDWKLGDPLKPLCQSAAHDTPSAHGGSASSAETQAEGRALWINGITALGWARAWSRRVGILILTFKGPSVSGAWEYDAPFRMVLRTSSSFPGSGRVSGGKQTTNSGGNQGLTPKRRLLLSTINGRKKKLSQRIWWKPTAWQRLK